MDTRGGIGVWTSKAERGSGIQKVADEKERRPHVCLPIRQPSMCSSPPKLKLLRAVDVDVGGL